ncbi:MAG: GldG family protein, partial [Desulfobaccales bacterium]
VYGAGSVLSVLLVLGILILVSLLATWRPLRWDTTKGETQSLSPVTQALLKQVTKPLTLTVFLPEGAGERQTAKEIVQLYTYNHPEVSYRFVDPERDPLQAQQAGYRYAGNVLLDYQGRRQMADQPDENAITNALRKVLNLERKKVYCLTGHGERSLDDAKTGGLSIAKKALENEGYEVANLNLLTQGTVPKDAAVLIVASPKKPLLVTEVQGLKAYLERDGRLLVMLEAFEDGGLKDFLADYGVVLDNGIILDVNQVSQALGLSAVMPIVSQYGPSKITRDFQNLVTIYPMARPLWLKKDRPELTLLPLATTMSTSYEKLGKEWVKADKAAFDAATDKKGPFTLAVQVEISLPPAKAPQAAKGQAAPPPPAAAKTYMVVYGAADFAANGFFNLFGNGDLFLNTTNFLAQAQEQITVRAAGKAQLLTLKTGQIWALFLTSLIWAPLVMLVAGIWAYRRRRARR